MTLQTLSRLWIFTVFLFSLFIIGSFIYSKSLRNDLSGRMIQSKAVLNPTTCSEFAAIAVENLQKVRVGGSTKKLNGYRMLLEQDCILYMKNLK